MLHLSQTYGYAVLALCCLNSEKESPVLVKHIAECTGMPLPYLSKVMCDLKKAGLIIGRRGTKGGYAFSRPPEEITLMDVAEAILGSEPLPECLLGFTDPVTARLCPLHDFWKVERLRIEMELKRINIAKAASRMNRSSIGQDSCSMGVADEPMLESNIICTEGTSPQPFISPEKDSLP